jgi:hypothetical protein
MPTEQERQEEIEALEAVLVEDEAWLKCHPPDTGETADPPVPYAVSLCRLLARLKAAQLHQPQTPETGLGGIGGQWPGTETDEQVAEGLARLQGEAAPAGCTGKLTEGQEKFIQDVAARAFSDWQEGRVLTLGAGVGFLLRDWEWPTEAAPAECKVAHPELHECCSCGRCALDAGPGWLDSTRGEDGSTLNFCPQCGDRLVGFQDELPPEERDGEPRAECTVSKADALAVVEELRVLARQRALCTLRASVESWYSGQANACSDVIERLTALGGGQDA